MNNNVKKYDEELKLGADGEVDVNYYLNKGEVLRAEFISELSRITKNKIKLSAIAFYEHYICVNCHPSH